ncbi:conserved hypothetical protein [Perkinsus marinus ATCC 50983]|uniref:Uncharacterized protein n=1 Tax=Perkinsus marinus (strain ATCC 50983 / TXsc) TaxID=423536 RepID=C5K499_PERM5|nr:conserved hypothetical protein [Perkinsus marinus ATCC 50983]EER20715.1 conserved hypothetical protein [Perkinsus marinus ATCC 50983]|eukprot:XP_002788919.1 conserved hypothetical protein [Perkinsus marinus ATCC 50983]
MEISSARRHKFGAKGWSFDDIRNPNEEDDDAEEEKATTEAKAASERESAAEAEEPSPEEGPPAEPTSSREGEDTARVKRSYTHGGDIDRAADPQDFPERPDSRHGGSRSLRSIRTFAGEPQQATDQTPLKVEVPEVSHSPDAAADEQSVDTAGEERAPAGPVAASEAEELQQFMADELSPAESFTVCCNLDKSLSVSTQDTFEEDQPDSPLSESMPSVDDGMVEEEAPTGALAAPQTEDPELMTDQLMSEEPSLAEPLTVGYIPLMS